MFQHRTNQLVMFNQLQLQTKKEDFPMKKLIDLSKKLKDTRMLMINKRKLLKLKTILNNFVIKLKTQSATIN